MLDAMDFLLYVMAIGRLKAYFGFDDATAGLLGTITLLISARGGLMFGVIADRLGRTRALMGTILHLLVRLARRGDIAEPLCSCCSGARCSGIGMGGEWASGAVLVSETWPPEHRNKAISIMQSGWAIGYILAALIAALVLERAPLGPEAWRWLFAVGVLPALFALWVRRNVREPAAWAAASDAASASGNPFRRDVRARAAPAAPCSPSCSPRRCSSRTGACSSGCPRSSRARSSRAAPA